VRLATRTLARDRRAPATGLSLAAVAARTVHLALGEHGLGYFAPVADRPGFPLAVARTLAELRLNRVAPESLAALGTLGRDLGMLAGRLARELEEPGLADRAILSEAAALDDSVSLSSWPGGARECVEIARGVQAEAARGVRFDRMAVFLRSPAEYRPHLEEAFRRASIPVFFARGTTRPDPAGRALLALLACKTERLSARRFAEYVSLAPVPDPGATETAAATGAAREC